MQTSSPSPADSAPVERSLLADDTLALRVQPEVWEAVARWVPRIPPRQPVADRVRAWICAEAGAPAFQAPARPAAFDLAGVNGWIDGSGRVLLLEPGGRVSAVVHPAERRAVVRLQLREGEELPLLEIFGAFTLVSALLLGRIGRTLVHAAAIEAPDGRAWLLAGGSFSGKSTSCITLIRGGWNYLADDHVILGRNADGQVWAEGWPRPFNLDDGYEAGASAGVRSRVDPAAFGPGAWVRSAPLAGLLFPRVEAENPTALQHAGPAGALSRLLGQSPWLMADAGAAASVFGLLRSVAEVAAYDLLLGEDCYRNPSGLQQVLVGVMHRPPA